MLSRLICLFALVALTSCGNLRKLVKAKPAKFSPFVEQASRLVRQPSNAAFHFAWTSRDRQAHEMARPVQEIYIAPVTLRHLRPMNVGTTKFNQTQGDERSEEAPNLAADMRRQFALELRQTRRRRYQLAMQPSARSLTVELAIVELNPTQPKINAAKFVAKMMFGPLGSVGGLAVQSSGNIAIEGKVRLSKTGQVLYQFTDNESDKLTLYSARDFRPYGHVRVAVEEWAGQFAEIMQRPPGTDVSDSSFWTLWPL